MCLVRANINDQLEYLKRNILVTILCMCELRMHRGHSSRLYNSYFIWSSESKHRRETICHSVYFKMAYAENDGLSLALDGSAEGLLLCLHFFIFPSIFNTSWKICRFSAKEFLPEKKFLPDIQVTDLLSLLR